MQSDQDGLSVISAPKTEMDKKKIAEPTELMYTLKISPIAANEKPIIAGTSLDIFHLPDL